jgi:hypothetical protein
MTDLERVMEAQLDIALHTHLGTLEDFLEQCDTFTALVALDELARYYDPFAFL